VAGEELGRGKRVRHAVNGMREDEPHDEGTEYIQAIAGKMADEFIAKLRVKDNRIPTTHNQAMRIDRENDNSNWTDAEKREMGSMESHSIWEMVDLPEGAHTIAGHYVYDLKLEPNGDIKGYKARWVAGGHKQIPGVDFNPDATSPVARIPSSKVVFTLAAINNLELRQIDIKTAYLNAPIGEYDIYMRPPPGYESGTKVCKLLKGLYGLHQSSSQWHEHLDKKMVARGWIALDGEPCLYQRYIDGRRVLALVYVDDITFAGSTEDVDLAVSEIKEDLVIDERGDMTDGMWLGVHVTRNRANGKIILDQHLYINEFLTRFHMDNAHTSKLPMSTTIELSEDDCPAPGSAEQKEMLEIPYREAVGTLLYLAQGTRPDIQYAVGRMAQFGQNPGKKHWVAVQQIFRYIKGTRKHVLVLGRDKKTDIIEVLTDADYAGDKETRLSTSGVLLTLFGSPIVWMSKKQRCIVTSAFEAELVASALGSKQVRWLRNLMRDLGFEVPPSPFWVDNHAVWNHTVNGRHSEKTKHIDVALKQARELQRDGKIDIRWVGMRDVPSDLFTNALGGPPVAELRRMIGVFA